MQSHLFNGKITMQGETIMFTLKPSLSLSCFGLRWIDQANRKYEITKNFNYVETKLKDMVDNGFEAVELVTAGPWNNEEEKANYPYVNEFAKLIKDSGLIYQGVHLPFSLPWWEYASPDENKRTQAVDAFKRAVDMHGEYLPNLFVIHPDEMPKNDEIRPFMLEQLTKSMEEICDFSPRTVCVENMVGNRLLNKMSEAKELLENVSKLCMTIDVNHSLLQKPEDYIACVGDRVKNLHISDNDGTTERHWLPGEGVINFNAILSNLEKIGYNGTFNYEVGAVLQKENGVKMVKENFDKLFSDYNNSK